MLKLVQLDDFIEHLAAPCCDERFDTDHCAAAECNYEGPRHQGSPLSESLLQRNQISSFECDSESSSDNGGTRSTNPVMRFIAGMFKHTLSQPPSPPADPSILMSSLSPLSSPQQREASKGAVDWGAKCSFGEQQKLAIARMLIKSPAVVRSVLLVL